MKSTSYECGEKKTPKTHFKMPAIHVPTLKGRGVNAIRNTAKFPHFRKNFLLIPSALFQTVLSLWDARVLFRVCIPHSLKKIGDECYCNSTSGGIPRRIAKPSIGDTGIGLMNASVNEKQKPYKTIVFYKKLCRFEKSFHSFEKKHTSRMPEDCTVFLSLWKGAFRKTIRG